MKPECKPGDLALILRGKHDAGKIVRVIEGWHGQQIDGRLFAPPISALWRNDKLWVVEIVGGSGLTIQPLNAPGQHALVSRSRLPDAILLPLRDDDDVDNDEALTDFLLEFSHD